MRQHASPELGSVQLFLAYIFCTLGGTALASFLLGQPPGWLAVDRVCACYVVSFALMRYPPFSSHFLRLFDVPLVLPWLILFQDIGFSHAITSFGFDRALLSPSSLYSVAAKPEYASTAPYFHPATHLSFYSAVACAWLSATGGGLLRHSLCLLDRDWRFQFPHAVLSPPSVHCRLALLLSVLYWAVTDAHGWLGVRLLSSSDARFCVMAVVVSQVSGPRLVAWWQGREQMAPVQRQVAGVGKGMAKPLRTNEQQEEVAAAAGANGRTGEQHPKADDSGSHRRVSRRTSSEAVEGAATESSSTRKRSSTSRKSR